MRSGSPTSIAHSKSAHSAIRAVPTSSAHPTRRQTKRAVDGHFGLWKWGRGRYVEDEIGRVVLDGELDHELLEAKS